MSTNVLLVFGIVVLTPIISCSPGGSYHHVHHRIHVPQKIKTIYHTKIIKVPEHHHHFHEKEKIIIEKEKPKEEEEHQHTIILKGEEHEDDWSELDSYKKKKRNVLHVSSLIHKGKKKKRVVRQHHPYKFHTT